MYTPFLFFRGTFLELRLVRSLNMLLCIKKPAASLWLLRKFTICSAKVLKLTGTNFFLPKRARNKRFSSIFNQQIIYDPLATTMYLILLISPLRSSALSEKLIALWTIPEALRHLRYLRGKIKWKKIFYNLLSVKFSLTSSSSSYWSVSSVEFWWLGQILPHLLLPPHHHLSLPWRMKLLLSVKYLRCPNW